MPIAFDQMNAKLSQYRGNGPLNALVHVFADKIANIPVDNAVAAPPVTTRADLCAAFHAEWGTYLDWAQLQAVLTATTDPMHREMLLGPVLRRLLPDEGQGGDGATEVSVDAVATLGKRFGIRVEAYQDYAGLRAEIREKLLKEHPGIEEDALRHLGDKAFKRALGPEIKRRFMGAPDNLPEAVAIQRAAQELQSILAGNRPHFPTREQVDLVGIPDPDRLAEGGIGHFATLSLNRVADGYRFGKSDNAAPNVNTFGTAVHNLSQGYKTPCDYAQAAPVLREQLRAAVSSAVKAAPAAGIAAGVAIAHTMRDKTSEIFSAYQAGPPKAGKTGDAAKGGLGGMMDGLLGNVSTFFGGGEADVFGSLKGIMGMLGGIFEPIMKMLMGFQDTLSESAKKPGDPFSKKEMDSYTAQSEALGKAASDFSIRLETLGAESTSARLLHEAWRKNPDATGVWASLIDKLVSEGDLAAADNCLHDQESKMLGTLQTVRDSVLAKGGNVVPLDFAINYYREAFASLETPELRREPESIQARLVVFKELDAKVRELEKKNEGFIASDAKAQEVRSLAASLTAQVTAAGASVPASLTARLAEATREMTHLFGPGGNNGQVESLKQSANALLRQAPFSAPPTYMFDAQQVANSITARKQQQQQARAQQQPQAPQAMAQPHQQHQAGGGGYGRARRHQPYYR
jgi:hypothetical protein